MNIKSIIIALLGLLAVLFLSYKIATRRVLNEWSGYTYDNEDFELKCNISYEEAVEYTKNSTQTLEALCPNLNKVKKYPTGGATYSKEINVPFIVLPSLSYVTIALILLLKTDKRRYLNKNNKRK